MNAVIDTQVENGNFALLFEPAAGINDEPHIVIGGMAVYHTREREYEHPVILTRHSENGFVGLGVHLWPDEQRVSRVLFDAYCTFDEDTVPYLDHDPNVLAKTDPIDTKTCKRLASLFQQNEDYSKEQSEWAAAKLTSIGFAADYQRYLSLFLATRKSAQNADKDQGTNYSHQ